MSADPRAVMPEPGQVWRSRDKRDDGLKVTVLNVANGFVRIRRHRITTVSLNRFHRDYELYDHREAQA